VRIDHAKRKRMDAGRDAARADAREGARYAKKGVRKPTGHRPATAKQIAYLRGLASRLGRTVPSPLNRNQAADLIDRWNRG
jgi:hypothetical protein